MDSPRHDSNLGNLEKSAPKINSGDTTQVAALPLNIWLKTDPWGDKETMLNARSFTPTSARDASRTPNAGCLILAGPFVRTGQDWGQDCGQDCGQDWGQYSGQDWSGSVRHENQMRFSAHTSHYSRICAAP